MSQRIVVLAWLPLAACHLVLPLGASDDVGGGVDTTFDLALEAYVADAHPDDTLPAGESPMLCSSPPFNKSCSEDVTTGLTWCTIPAGCFVMGSPESEPCREPDAPKETQHEVHLRAFVIMATEVTQKQYEDTMKVNPSVKPCDPSCPVETVSWHDATRYCNALSNAGGLSKCYDCIGVTCGEVVQYGGQQIYDCPGYRLPTEAEWERAYRAGTSTAYYIGPNDGTLCETCVTGQLDLNLDTIGWYCNNAQPFVPRPVGGKQPNDWGLHDMAGNVWEWCHDGYQADLGGASVVEPVTLWLDTKRMIRGGCGTNWPSKLRAAAREARSSSYKGTDVGFRCVRSLSL